MRTKFENEVTRWALLLFLILLFLGVRFLSEPKLWAWLLGG
jgi:hypothetical protein